MCVMNFLMDFSLEIGTRLSAFRIHSWPKTLLLYEKNQTQLTFMGYYYLMSMIWYM